MKRRRKFDVQGRDRRGLIFWKDFSSLHAAQAALRDLEFGRIVVDGTLVKTKGAMSDELTNALVAYSMAHHKKR